MNEHVTKTSAATPIKPLAPKVPDVPPVPKAPDAPKSAEAKAPKAPKEKAPPRESNFKKVYPDSAVVTILTEGKVNPKRKGSKAYDRFAHYKDGITIAEAIKAGVTYADVSWDVGHGLIAVSK